MTGGIRRSNCRHKQRRQGTLDALVAQVAALSHQNPRLIIFEDAHWTDPTGLELFSRIIDKIPTLRVLLLITFRPDFEPPWVGQPHVTTVTINRLTPREVGAMIDRVASNKVLPTNIRQDIVERTDGIPLFVEEMTKAVLEAESQSAAGSTAAAIPALVPAVPATLHASLMARLDRLGAPGKEVAQVGAAIGREFSHALLAMVTRKPEADPPVGTEPPCSGWVAVPAGRTATRHLSVQARTGTGRILQHPLARASTCPSRRYC
jgi:predicted ATPase